jgi:hypothetical protein
MVGWIAGSLTEMYQLHVLSKTELNERMIHDERDSSG